MDGIYMRSVSFPARVHGVTVKDDEGNYNVYINSNLCESAQKTALWHELVHIQKDHLYNEDLAAFNENDVEDLGFY